MSNKIQSKQTKIDLIKNAVGDRVITPAMVSTPLTELNEDKLEKDLSNLPENSKTKIKEIANEDKAPELFKQSSENKEQALSDTKYTYGGLGINTEDVTASLSVKPKIEGTIEKYTLNFTGAEIQGYRIGEGHSEHIDNVSSYTHILLNNGTKYSFRIEEKQRRAIEGSHDEAGTVKAIIIDDIEDPQGTNNQLEGVRFINDNSEYASIEPLAEFGDTTIMADGSVKLSERGLEPLDSFERGYELAVIDGTKTIRKLDPQSFLDGVNVAKVGEHGNVYKKEQVDSLVKKNGFFKSISGQPYLGSKKTKGNVLINTDEVDINTSLKIGKPTALSLLGEFRLLKSDNLFENTSGREGWYNLPGEGEWGNRSVYVDYNKYTSELAEINIVSPQPAPLPPPPPPLGDEEGEEEPSRRVPGPFLEPIRSNGKKYLRINGLDTSSMEDGTIIKVYITPVGSYSHITGIGYSLDASGFKVTSTGMIQLPEIRKRAISNGNSNEKLLVVDRDGIVLETDISLNSIKNTSTDNIEVIEQQVDYSELRDNLRIKWIYSKNNLIVNLIFENLDGGSFGSIIGQEINLGRITPNLAGKFSTNKDLSILTSIGKFRISTSNSIHLTVTNFTGDSDFIITENIIL